MPFLSTSHNYDASVLIKLMEGLSIGYQTNPKDAEYIKRYISKSIEEIKEIYPYKIDDCVTLTDTYLEDKVITIKLIVSDESKLLETYPNYMLKACEVISRTIAKRSVFFLSKYGYTVRCIITNNGGSVLYDNEIRSSYLSVFILSYIEKFNSFRKSIFYICGHWNNVLFDFKFIISSFIAVFFCISFEIFISKFLILFGFSIPGDKLPPYFDYNVFNDRSIIPNENDNEIRKPLL